tara:strand:- start:1029 stop:1964 length:936 start_codon:yes stop_codon:yes gene_type:complete
LNKKLKPINTIEIVDGDTVISYSQFSMYDQCPKRWEMKYVRGHKEDIPNIHLVFGTAIHNTIQTWLHKRFGDIDREYDLVDSFEAEMHKEFVDRISKHGDTFSTPDELTEFYLEGISILKFIKDRSWKFFCTKKLEYIGSEIKLTIIPDHTKPRLKFVAYLDLVFNEIKRDEYLIRDIKTSTRGWNHYQLSDNNKISQLILYKHFFSKQYGIELDKIHVDYFIVKREVEEDSPYGSSRVQEFSPPQHTQFVDRIVKKLQDFVDTAFDADGIHRRDIEYPAIEGPTGNNCRFCELADNDILCPKSKRMNRTP